MTSRRAALIFAVLLTLSALCLVPLVAIDAQQEQEPRLPVLAKAPSFVLTDSRGGALDSKSLAGKVWVANFMFTNCPGACPIMATDLSKLQRLYHAEPDFALVSFSVDPERDTPEALNAFAAKYEADTSQWRFLRGDMAEINRLSSVNGFLLGDIDGPASHSLRHVLVDKKGNVRGYFESGGETELKELSDAVAILLAEK